MNLTTLAQLVYLLFALAGYCVILRNAVSAATAKWQVIVAFSALTASLIFAACCSGETNALTQFIRGLF